MADAIAGVRFDLSANSAQLEAALNRASKSLRDASRAGEQAGTAIVAALSRIGGLVAAAFGVDNLIRFTTQAIASAAALGRLADQAGLTVQQFQGLDFALRGAMVPTEQLAQGFAIFARNLSDLQRGTGPFLDFLRRSAPQLVAQFRAAKDTNEAFLVLTNAVATLGDAQDRVRLLNAAGAEQFGRLANTMRQGRGAIEETARSFQGLSDEAIRGAQEIQLRWNEASREITLQAQRMGVAVAEALNIIARPQLQQLEQAVARARAAFEVAEHDFVMMRRSRQEDEVTIRRVTEAWRGLTQALSALSTVTSGMPSGPLKIDPGPVDTWRLTADRIKAAQGELALFMARLQTLPPQTEFISQSFAAAWARMAAAMRLTGETEAAISAARINLLRQEDAARQSILGASITLEEQFTRRMHELSQARQQGLISEMDLIRARNQLQMQSASVIAGALAQTANSLAQAFQKFKAVQIAAAIANTAQSITATLAQYGYTPWGIAAAAAAAVAGATQIANIRSANPGSGGSAPSFGGGTGGGAAQPAQAMPQQTLIVQGLTPGQLITTDYMRTLAERMLEFQRDGGRVILA